MTVLFGPTGLVSDKTAAEARPTRNNLFVLRCVDGIRLHKVDAYDVLSRIRQNAHAESVGTAEPAEDELLALDDIDGVPVDRDTALEIMRRAETAVKCAESSTVQRRRS